MKSFTAGKNDANVRLLRFCEKQCPTMPSGLLHKAFRNKRIKINGKKQDENYRLCEGDLIELYINDEFFENTPKSTSHKSLTVELNVVFEDENILIIYKPAGLLCHSDNKNEPNVIDSAVEYLTNKGEYNRENENTFSPALCNRIDQGTEGLVIIAKNYRALADMNEIIRDDLLTKNYLCITEKTVKDGKYTAFLTRDKNAKKVYVSANETSDSKRIVTGFKTIKKNDRFNLIEVTLYTGRTHQIRAHLAYLGAPITGDKKYGKAYKGVDSQLLCAYKISFSGIGENNSLSYLNDKQIKIEKNSVTDFFNKSKSK